MRLIKTMSGHIVTLKKTIVAYQVEATTIYLYAGQATSQLMVS